MESAITNRRALALITILMVAIIGGAVTYAVYLIGQVNYKVDDSNVSTAGAPKITPNGVMINISAIQGQPLVDYLSSVGGGNLPPEVFVQYRGIYRYTCNVVANGSIYVDPLMLEINKKLCKYDFFMHTEFRETGLYTWQLVIFTNGELTKTQMSMVNAEIQSVLQEFLG